MDASLVGSQLGKYEIQAEIGRGGMGTVYRGYDRQLDRHVAVKVLAPHLLWEKAFVERFLREARAAARLKHPNIVTIHDVGQAGGWYYFVMAYLEGQTLTQHVRQRGPLQPDEASAILRPLADALDYAHQRGLVHRDVKPDNIIVDREGRVTLTDFGIARAAQETRLTTTGAVVGTPEYMSPEQAKGLAVSARSDQYSLAVVAYEMLSGQVPFEAESTLALLHKIAYDPPPPVGPARSDLPAGVDSVLARALDKEPGTRYARVRDFVQALEEAFQGATPEALAGQPQATFPPGPAALPAQTRLAGAPAGRRIPAWGWLAGGLALVALLVLMVVGGWIVGRAVGLFGGTAGPTEASVERTATGKPEPTRTPPPAASATPPPPPTLTAMPTDAPTAAPTVVPTPIPTPMPPYPTDMIGRISFTRKSIPWSDNTSEIWVLSLDTGSLTQLTHNNAVDWIPSWSPDGGRIVFTSNRRDGNYDLWVTNADGSDPAPWITLDAWDEYAAWSPDGRWLAFSSTGETSGVYNSEIFSADSAGSTRRLTFNKGADEWPTWSPDGRQIACSSDEDGDMDVWIFRADGTGRKNWTADTANNEHPAWSPDGEWIAFIRMAQMAPDEVVFRGDVWIGRTDGSEFRRLTEDGLAANPAWSPDGRYVVFTHFLETTGDGEITREDAADLWAVGVDGGGPYMLTEGSEQDYAPDWTR